MAAYGTLVAWAAGDGALPTLPSSLQQTLDEEKAADEKLSALAEGGINQRAAGSMGGMQDDEELDEDVEEDEEVAPKAAPRKAAKKTAAKKTARKSSGRR